MKNKTINLFEAFSWIWSQHQALKNLWFNVNIVWISDWYIDAIVAYWINHLKLKAKKIDKLKIINFLNKYSLSLDSKNPAKSFSTLTDKKLSIVKQVIDMFWNLDIRNISWENLANKNIDLFTYSFPCQDISQQWKQKWFWKDIVSRSWLLWEIERILKEIYHFDKTKLPKVLLMENVKALLNDSFKDDFNMWVLELKKLWYKSTKPFVVNACDLWEAQRRERGFMLSYLWDKEPKEFKITNKFRDKFIWDIFENKLSMQIKNEFKKCLLCEIMGVW